MKIYFLADLTVVIAKGCVARQRLSSLILVTWGGRRKAAVLQLLEFARET